MIPVRQSKLCARSSITALKRSFAVISLALTPFAAGHVLTQAQTPIRIDASQPYTDPGPASYDEGSATSPSGKVIGLNSRYLMLDGKPWLPVMGEFHFSRYPASHWEEEILKMKAGGVNIVSTYVIWIHHQEVESQFNWTGQRDLRAFAQLCAKHDMLLVVRIGPWAHGEARNGGFPDWVVKASETRVNDPVYLSEVRTWYGQIGQQLKGLLWKDGGPIIGIQLENEYSKRGPGAGEEHILQLKKMAIESGFDVPLYLLTGWDNAVVPKRAVVPLYGGYPAAPWNGSLAKLPPQEVYSFRFQSRVTASMGAIGSPRAHEALSSTQDQLPYLTTEIGGGNEVTYHRRPVIESDDIAAMVPVMLGSGVNLYGTYMLQGGENPDGKLSTLQESQATGYPNDVPVKSYDFQAPLGEFGQERASFRKLKVFQYFLNDFGADLAPMTVHAPDQLPMTVDDFTVSRASVRSSGDAGFIFLNNYVRGYSMPARVATQFDVRLPSGPFLVPSHPIDIPSGVYFIWPFNLRVGGITLRYSTAQLFTRIENGSDTTLYFEAVRGISAEFAFDAASVRTLHTSSGESSNNSGTISVTGLDPGVESSIDLVSKHGENVRIVLLTPQEAEDAWKVRIAGSEHLLITAHDLFADPDAATSSIWLRTRETSEFTFSVTPPITTPAISSLPLTRTAENASLVSFRAQAAPLSIHLQYLQVRSPGSAPPVTEGPSQSWRPRGAAQAPAEDTFSQAARWSFTLPPGVMDHLSELFLDVDYQGDIARLSAGGKLLTDDFYNGHPWSVGLGRYLQPQGATTFDLCVLPLRKDAPVYLELPGAIEFSAAGQIDRLAGLNLVPEYQLVLESPATPDPAKPQSSTPPPSGSK